MSNIKLNCCGCGKELGLGSRVSTDGVLWRCKDCTRKQKEEYDNKDQKIADLEAKLAECEKEIKYYANRNVELLDESLNLTRANNTYFDENKKLKQQLAEKEEQLKYYETLLKRQCNECKDQDKISFCIEQLEKVKEFAEDILDDAIKNCSLNESYYDNLLDKIDDQIASLKKGVE